VLGGFVLRPEVPEPQKVLEAGIANRDVAIAIGGAALRSTETVGQAMKWDGDGVAVPTGVPGDHGDVAGRRTRNGDLAHNLSLEVRVTAVGAAANTHNNHLCSGVLGVLKYPEILDRNSIFRTSGQKFFEQKSSATSISY
jgi:hypothetical protein